MSQGQNTRAIYVNAFTMIPALVKLFESLFGHGTGAEKKAAVTAVVGSVLTAGAGAAAANNPQYKDAIGAVIDAAAGALFPSTPPPVEAPPAVDVAPSS